MIVFIWFVLFLSISVGTVFGHASVRKNMCLLWVSEQNNNLLFTHQKQQTGLEVFRLEI